MLKSTRQDYESKIENLEENLARANDRYTKERVRCAALAQELQRLRLAREVGEKARTWAIEEAMRFGHVDAVAYAKILLEFVYGPDTGPDRPAENPDGL